MLYNLLAPLGDDYIIFNLFRYLTFRGGAAVMTALLISFLIGPAMIQWLKTLQAGASNVREYLEDTHAHKAGTPSMGGLMILVSVTLSTLLWSDLTNPLVWYAVLVMVGYGALGFADDYLKVSKKNSKGLPGKLKLLGQFVIGGIATWGIMQALPADIETAVAIPFLKHFFINLGWFFIPWALLVMVGASNAVNLTD
ncbi:MAG: phospho-N-acetylmuramoyl-pentapeptide-transferase, partial [Alphaproteobacteria bacterium]|nr:phospho-N-acetylmuramoyl-pentapeptide-transferase [Alphaproteobacteria bacterium]